MKLISIAYITTVAIFLSACSTTPTPRKVSMAEIMALENQILTAATSQPTPPQPEKLYTQPANKTEPCKLPTSKEQLERKNFRIYWDGDCKNGYAFGLGRDIALSDTHHMEEITIHNGEGNSTNGSPSVFIDFVQNSSYYVVNNGADFDGLSGYQEYITNDSAGISIIYNLLAYNNKGYARGLRGSPFNPIKTVINQTRGKPVYVLLDYSGLPATSDQAQMVLFTADPATQKPIGFRIVRFRNGFVQHQRLAPDGQSIAELVQLAPEYIAQLQEKIGEAQTAAQKASVDAARAQRMEREYFHMACAADYNIKGVPAKDMKIARQICTWRDQWKEPYAQAEAKYKQEIEKRKQEVSQAEQQRAYIAAQRAQAAAAQAKAESDAWAEFGRAMQSITPKTTTTNCYGTFGGVNCRSTTY